MQNGSPVTADQLKIYAEPRELYEWRDDKPHAAIVGRTVLVDGFRFSAAYFKWKAPPPGAIPSPEPSEGGDVSAPPVWASVFVLTHFHSDHYVGLHKNWRHGPIVCTPVTARLLSTQLGVSADIVTPVDFNQPVLLDLARPFGDDGRLHLTAVGAPPTLPSHVSLTFVDANHCPGAAMVVAKIASGQTFVHTGDFRYNGVSRYRPGAKMAASPRGSGAHMNGAVKGFGRTVARTSSFSSTTTTTTQPSPMSATLPPSTAHATPPSAPSTLAALLDPAPMDQSAALLGVAGKVDKLFLDNTFCDPSYAFPTQAQVFQEIHAQFRAAALRAFERALHSRRSADSELSSAADRSAAAIVVNVAVLVSTYTIGKERVALALLRHLAAPRLRFLVSTAKAQILAECGFAVDRCAAGEPTDDGAASVVESAPSAAPFAETTATVIGASHGVAVDGAAVFQGQPPRGLELRVVPMLVPFSAVGVGAVIAALKQGHSPGPIDTTATMTFEMAAAAVDDSFALSAEARSAAVESPPRVAGGPRYGLPLWDGTSLDFEGFDGVLSIEPTGWAARGAPSSFVKTIERFTMFRVPYSEHCSFNELIDFVSFVGPKVVVATVSPENFSRHEPLFVEWCPRLKSRYSNVQPLSNFRQFFKDTLMWGQKVIAGESKTAVAVSTSSPADKYNDDGDVEVVASSPAGTARVAAKCDASGPSPSSVASTTTSRGVNAQQSGRKRERPFHNTGIASVTAAVEVSDDDSNDCILIE